MSDALLIVAALAATLLGMGWFALAMDVHWKQVHGRARRSDGSVVILRVLGWAAVASSLVLCLLADVATMAVLVWMMLLATSAGATAFVLSWRPRLLAPLAAWA